MADRLTLCYTGGMDHVEFKAFLERHSLTQTEFGTWFGRKRDSIWRHTLPPENKHHRPVSDELEAFCMAYELLPDPKRKRLILTLKAKHLDPLEELASVRLRSKPSGDQS